MSRKLWVFVLAGVVSALGAPSAKADDAKKAAKSEIQGGIEGHVKSVDASSGTLTITTSEGKDRTFTTNDETSMLGPRGGIVKSRLKDHRFHEGMALTIVASSSTATEIHLGYDRRAKDAKSDQPTTVARGRSKVAEQRAKEAAANKPEVRTSAKPVPEPEEDEDSEFPGKVKSYDASKHLLVISLMNGKDRSFMLASTVPVMVKGTASKQGLHDPSLKPGAQVTVVTDTGGRKVKEVKVSPASVTRAKKPAA